MSLRKKLKERREAFRGTKKSVANTRKVLRSKNKLSGYLTSSLFAQDIPKGERSY
jgi:hypothetical protein